MNMKKLMAVVLAVVIAVSAMAVNVFAGEGEIVKIPLRANQSRTNSRTVVYEFTWPVYGMFGYLDQNSYLELSLPNYFTDACENQEVAWTIGTNLGNKVALKTISSTSANRGFEKQYVNFGYVDRPYYNFNGDQWATIRQGTFGQITSITLTATVTLKDWTNQGWDPTWGAESFGQTWNAQAQNMYAQLWTAGADGVKGYTDGDEKVTGSVAFGPDFTVNKTDKSTSSNWNAFDFMSIPKVGETAETAVDLTWDMTLQNRAYVMNAEKAQIVVKLYNGPESSWKGWTNGIALYSLYAADTPITASDLGQIWWNSAAFNRVFVRESWINVAQKRTEELRFDISVDKLFNPTYSLGGAAGIASTFRVYAELETDASNLVNMNSWDINYCHWTNDAYIELTMPAVDEPNTDINVEDPVESTGSETDEPNIDVEDPTPETPVENNPPMGLSLVVLPMVLAAAAAVASKRR